MRWIVASATAAAVICLAVFGSIQLLSPDSADIPPNTGSIQTQRDNSLFPQGGIEVPAISKSVDFDVSALPADHSDNAFSLLAYIQKEQDDDTIDFGDAAVIPNGWIELAEYFEFDQTYSTYSIVTADCDPRIDPDYYFNQSLYRSIFLKCEGENIASVEFSVDEGGSFIKTSVLTENGVPVKHDDRSFTIISKQSLGSSFTLSSVTDIAEEFLLFVGKPLPDGEQAIGPNLLNLTVCAIATFTDGSTQEITIVVS